MNCVYCGGKIESKRVTFVYDYDNNYFLVENVPAEVCTQCREKTYSPEVTDDLIRLAQKKTQTCENRSSTCIRLFQSNSH